MKKILKYNGLSIVFLILFFACLIGQIITGLHEHNEQLKEYGSAPLSFFSYLESGHFLQATFENFESEFLQMALYVVLTIFLYQKGSSESKDPDKEEPVDEEPDPTKKDAPWPVRKGGIYLWIYKKSLFIVLMILFLLSLFMHFKGSLLDYNTEQQLKHLPTLKPIEFIQESRFWFESFQNWQSEFLSIFTIVILSIFLRQHGSPQSKPINEPDSKTGE